MDKTRRMERQVRKGEEGKYRGVRETRRRGREKREARRERERGRRNEGRERVKVISKKVMKEGRRFGRKCVWEGEREKGG